MYDDHLSSKLAMDLDANFEHLVLSYQGRLYGFALRMSGNPQDAEEIAQDAFVRAYHALATYTRDRICELKLRPWLYQITLNVARNRSRGKRLELVSYDGHGDASASPVREPEDDEVHRPEQLTLRHETAEELGELVAGLHARYRAAVVLRFVEGLSYAEAALVLDQTVGTVKANVHRGVQLLREAMSNRRGEVKAQR